MFCLNFCQDFINPIPAINPFERMDTKCDPIERPDLRIHQRQKSSDFLAPRFLSKINVDVSENSGFPPKSPHFDRVFHYFHHPFWGKHPYFWKHPCRVCTVVEK